MTLFEKFVMEGNEAALDGGAVATIKVATVRQKIMEVFASLQFAATFHRQVVIWDDCDELEPKPQDTLVFVEEKKMTILRRNEVLSSKN